MVGWCAVTKVCSLEHHYFLQPGRTRSMQTLKDMRVSGGGNLLESWFLVVLWWVWSHQLPHRASGRLWSRKLLAITRISSNPEVLRCRVSLCLRIVYTLRVSSSPRRRHSEWALEPASWSPGREGSWKLEKNVIRLEWKWRGAFSWFTLLLDHPTKRVQRVFAEEMRMS